MFLGFLFNFENCSVAISEERAAEICIYLTTLIRLPKVNTTHLQSIVGKLVFASQVVRGANTFTWHLFDAVAKIKGCYMPLSADMHADLGWWLRYLKLENGSRVVHWTVNRPLHCCCTDASDVAASGVFNHAAWIHAWFQHQCAWQINIKELWAVFHSLLMWSSQWKGHDVLFAVDNLTVFSWLNSGTACSPRLWQC